MSFSTLVPSLFGWRPSSLNSCLWPQKILKLSMKLTPYKSKILFFSPCFQVLYLGSKRNVKNVTLQTENTKYFCDLFTFVIFKTLTWIFTEQRSHLLIAMGEMDFCLSLLLLIFCAVLLVTVLFLFQKAAINNTLITKECSCDFIH